MRQPAATICVMTILLVGCSPQPTPTALGTAIATPSTPAPATSAPVNAAPSIESSTPASAGWQPVTAQDSVTGTQFQAVAWTGTRFVATGIALGGEGVFLDSPDGLSWHRQDGAGKAAPDAIAAGPRGVVAVGTIGDGSASWSSPDGLSWTARRDAFPASVTGSDTVKVTGVVSTGDGWLAVGREDPACNFNCGLAPIRSLVWTSRDGLHWAAVAKQRSLAGAGMNGVAAGGPGYVAAGTGRGRAAVWASADGSDWSRIPDDAMFHPQPGSDPSAWVSAVGVAAGHGVAVVVGWAYGVGPGGEPAVVAWWSADGRTWMPAMVDQGPGGQVFGVATTPTGFLATGPSGEPSCLGGIWASTDGRAWQCVASDPALKGFGPYAAAGSPTTEIAVGLTSAGGDSPQGLPGAVWWRSVP